MQRILFDKRKLWGMTGGMLVAALVLLVASKHGIGLTHDSGIYVLSAKMLFREGALIDYRGGALNLYPPLYIMLLSLYEFTAFDLYSWAIFLQALAYGFTFYFTHQLAALLFKDRNYFFMVCLWTLLSLPLLVNAVFLWSEAFFILFVIWTLYLCIQYGNHALGYRQVGLLSLVSLLAVMQRYAGITLVITVFLFLFFTIKKNSLQKAFIVSSAYAFIPTFFMLAWAYRNHVLAGGTIVHDQWFLHGPFYNTAEALVTLGSFFIPDELTSFVLIPFSISVVGLFFYSIRKIPQEVSVYFKLIFLFTLIYLLFFIVMNSLLYVSALDERYMSPLYIPLVLLGFKSIEVLLKTTSFGRVKKSVKTAVFFLGALITVYLFIRVVHFATGFYKTGAGYGTASWKKDPVILYAQTIKESQKIVSNNPMPLLVHEVIAFAPTRPLSFYKKGTESVLYIQWKKGNSLDYLVLTNDLNNGRYVLDTLRLFPSAIIYKVNPKP
jgi:hypothetical protein